MDRPSRWWGLALGLAGAALHLPALDGEFVFDDAGQIGRETWQGAGGSVLHHLGPGLLSRGLVQATYLLNHRLCGLSPAGWHAVNLAAYAGLVGMVFVLARALSAGRAFPFLAALWFAVQPSAAESASYVSGRPGLLAALFAVATAAWAAERVALDPPWRVLTGVALGSLLAAGCKETGWAAPFLALLVSWPSVRARWAEWRTPLLAGLAAGLLLGLAWFRRSLALHPGHWLGQAGVWGSVYAPRWLLPFGPWAPCADLDPSPSPWMALPLLAALLLPRRAALWILLAALPVSLVPLTDLAAERHMLLASAGASLAAGVFLARMPRAAAGVLLAGLALAAWARAGAFREDRGFWRDTLRKAPRERAAYNYGLALARTGDHGRAVGWYRRAERAQPFRALIPSALGLSLALKGDLAGAAEAYGRAVLLEAAAIRAGDQPLRHRAMLRTDAENRSRCLEALGRPAEAEAARREARGWLGP